MIFSLTQIIHWLSVYGYLLLFPLTVIEGPIVTMIAGMLSAQGILNPFVAYAVIVIADVVGDFLYYSIGYMGRNTLIVHFGHYVGVDMNQVKNSEEHFKKHGGKMLIFGKITHLAGAPILIAAGAMKMPLSRFLLYTFIPTIPKSLFFLLIGYYFGMAFIHVGNGFNYLALLTVIVTGALTFFYLKSKYRED